jgi:hypothetical protein
MEVREIQWTGSTITAEAFNAKRASSPRHQVPFSQRLIDLIFVPYQASTKPLHEFN